MAFEDFRLRHTRPEPSGEEILPRDAAAFKEALSHINAGAAEVLTKRLQQLQDRPLMKAVLGAALQEMLRNRIEVDQYQIEYCKIKPWPDINLALQLTLRDKAAGGLSRRYVSCTIRGKPSSALEQFHLEISQLKHTADQPHPITLVPGMGMVVRLFPFDPALSGLGPATDVPAMLELFRAHLPECRNEGWWPTDLRYEVVHYKPGRLCTLRYSVKLEHPTLRMSRSVDVFAKVFRDDRWRACCEFQTALWQAACASDGVWRTARPVASVPEWRVALQEALSGRPFRHVFAELTHAEASDEELHQVERHLTAVARAIRSMQLAPVRLGPTFDFPALWASQGRNLPYLKRSQPALAKDLNRLRKELVKLEAAIPRAPLTLAHGDFAYGNVLLDDEVVGIIDFDKGGQAEPAYDAAYFLTHLSSYGIRHPKRQPHVARVCEAFRSAYLSLAPEVSPHRLALYEALDLTAYVLRNFRKQSHQANWVEWAQAQTECAWQRLNFAARQTRCAP
jgi:Ser/Thr protein kinase RdoA (MazF antagonist)